MNTAELARWAQPRVVVSCQGRPGPSSEVRQRYRQAGAQLLDTHRHGAVLIHSSAAGLVVETHVTRQRLAVRLPAERD